MYLYIERSWRCRQCSLLFLATETKINFLCERNIKTLIWHFSEKGICFARGEERNNISKYGDKNEITKRAGEERGGFNSPHADGTQPKFEFQTYRHLYCWGASVSLTNGQPRSPRIVARPSQLYRFVPRFMRPLNHQLYALHSARSPGRSDVRTFAPPLFSSANVKLFRYFFQRGRIFIVSFTRNREEQWRLVHRRHLQFFSVHNYNT